MKKIEEVVKEYVNSCGADSSPISSNDRFHTGYGCICTVFAKGHLQKLLAGEPLWFDDGEYSHILIYETSNLLKK